MNWFETLALWLETKRQIKELQETERVLRVGLFKGTFPNPKEGTNNFALPPGERVGGLMLPVGATLKGILKFNRRVIPEQVDRLAPPERSMVDPYLRLKPDLKLREYRQALGTQNLQPVIETLHSVMVITPATPELKLHLPGMKDEDEDDSAG